MVVSYWTAATTVRRHRAVFPEGIAAHAVELLDRSGYEGFSFRRLAESLEVAPASLYSRVRGPSDVFDLALDHVLAQDEGVQAAIAAGTALDILNALHRHLVDHSWAVHVVAAAPPRGPAYLSLSEALVVRLSDAGHEDVLSLAYATTNLVIGSAVTAQASCREPDEPIDPEREPTYGAMHATMSSTPEEVLESALRALLGRQ